MKEVSKACGGMPLKNTARNFKKSFRVLFGRSKRNIDNSWMSFIQLPTAPFLLTSFGDERSKTLWWLAVKLPARSKNHKYFSLPFCLPKRKKKPAGSRQNRTANPGTPRFRSLPAECRKYPPHASGGSPGHNTPATSAGLSDTAPGQTRNSRCQTARTCRSPGPSSCTG